MVNIPATQFSRQVSGVAGGSKMLASDVADVRALCVSEQKMDAGPAKYIRKKKPNRILKHTLIQVY